MPTKINWTQEVWNPVTGCNKNCEFCYARKFAKRLQANPNTKIAHKYRNGFTPTFHPGELDTPKKWKKPRIVFAPSMGDMFDPAITFKQHCQIFQAMADAAQHTYLILTKYPENIINFIEKCEDWNPKDWKNVWFGVSVSTQKEADKRIQLLSHIPHCNFFVSVEPILEPINITSYLDDIHIKWVIGGGLTGKNANKKTMDWLLELCSTCQDAKVPFFYKSNGTGNMAFTKYVRQFPDFNYNPIS